MEVALQAGPSPASCAVGLPPSRPLRVPSLVVGRTFAAMTPSQGGYQVLEPYHLGLFICRGLRGCLFLLLFNERAVKGGL